MKKTLAKIFYIYSDKGFGWVRILGYGVMWKNTSIIPMSFSERNGYKKSFYIGSYLFVFLNKIKL